MTRCQMQVCLLDLIWFLWATWYKRHRHFSPSFSHAFSLWTAFTYIINFMLAFIFCALDSRRENTYACLMLRVIHIIYDCKEGSPPSSHCVMSLVFKYFFFLCWEQSEVRMQDFTVISTPDGDVPNSLFKVSMWPMVQPRGFGVTWWNE